MLHRFDHSRSTQGPFIHMCSIVDIQCIPSKGTCTGQNSKLVVLGHACSYSKSRAVTCTCTRTISARVYTIQECGISVLSQPAVFTSGVATQSEHMDKTKMMQSCEIVH